jgi:integrase
VDQGRGAEVRRLPVPEPHARLASLGDAPVRADLEGWVEELGLDPAEYGTHSMRRTKATLIYRRTKNLRAVQLLLGHSKLESTVRYLGIEVDDALEISEQTEI